MSDTPPKWDLEQHPNYNSHLKSASAREFTLLENISLEATTAFMRDTRVVHARLYSPLAPSEFIEYAGTYRGAAGTSLESKTAVSQLVTRPGELQTFTAPEKVGNQLIAIDGHIDTINKAHLCGSALERFNNAAKLFYIFGLAHPFLNGNGHIQRLLFAAAIPRSSNIELEKSWTIHPRPYGEEMAKAFEQNTTTKRMDAVARELRKYVNH